MPVIRGWTAILQNLLYETNNRIHISGNIRPAARGKFNGVGVLFVTQMAERACELTHWTIK